MNDRKSGSLGHSSDAAPDLLSDLLRTVRLSGAVFFDVHATQPWVAEAPPMAEIAAGLMPGAQHVIPFHALASGTCHAVTPGQRAVALRAGDVVLFPRGDAHVMASRPGLRAPADTDSYQRARYDRLPVRISPGGGGKPAARLICGFLGCDARPFNPLLDALPRVLVARKASGGRGHWLHTFMETALAESQARTEGSEVVLARLSELMFVEVVRRHLQSIPARARGWLAGLRDPLVGAALALLHARPALDWTLPLLAQRCGTSRSVLAERFAQLVGMPPMHYLARWRMQLAANMLRSGRHKVAAVALAVGYDTEAAFSRAFKKLVGVSPAHWRRRQGGLPTS